MSETLFLFAFDFDDTLIDAHSDKFVQRKLHVEPLAEQMKLYFEEGQETFAADMVYFMYPNTKRRTEYDAALSCIPMIENMSRCIKELKELGAEIIVISDGNTYFIERVLEHNNLLKFFNKILANPSEFDEEGNLVISPYHVNLECKLSSRSLCKGRVLLEYLAERMREGVQFQFVAYAGDGINDYCPMSRLHSGDVACPRKDHYICEFIEEMEDEEGVSLRARVIEWADSMDIVVGMENKLRDLDLI